MHEKYTSKSAYIIYENIHYADFTKNSELLEIYNLGSSTVRKPLNPKSKISKQGSTSLRRREIYKKPK